jgi:hypothetical protein
VKVNLNVNDSNRRKIEGHNWAESVERPSPPKEKVYRTMTKEKPEVEEMKNQNVSTIKQDTPHDQLHKLLAMIEAWENEGLKNGESPINEAHRCSISEMKGDECSDETSRRNWVEGDTSTEQGDDIMNEYHLKYKQSQKVLNENQEATASEVFGATSIVDFANADTVGQ